MYQQQGEYPKLKGKAGEIRHLRRAILGIFLQSADRGDELLILLMIALEACCKLEDLIDAHKDEYVFPPDAAREFLETTMIYCQSQSRLSNWGGATVFKITMKHHYLVHAASRAGFLNPRLVWCFMGEDYMSHMRTLAGSCLKGVPAIKLSHKMAKKVSLAMHLQLSGIRR